MSLVEILQTKCDRCGMKADMPPEDAIEAAGWISVGYADEEHWCAACLAGDRGDADRELDSVREFIAHRIASMKRGVARTALETLFRDLTAKEHRPEASRSALALERRGLHLEEKAERDE